VAHVGKNYKLQFRRDTHLDVNNALGYPEAFSAFFDQLVIPQTTSGLGITFQCVNLATLSQPPMTWSSNWVTAWGTQWRTSFEFTQPATRIGDLMPIIYTLEETIGGIVIAWTSMTRVNNYQSYQTSAFGGTGTVAAGYLWGATSQTFLGHALNWAAYNP